MIKIKNFLNVSILRLNKRVRNNGFIELNYEIRTSKKESNQILIDYLDNYPLFSSKYFDYLNWKDIYNIKIKKMYKTTEGTNELKLLKFAMNNKRTNFNWDHLNNFWSI